MLTVRLSEQSGNPLALEASPLVGSDGFALLVTAECRE